MNIVDCLGRNNSLKSQSSPTPGSGLSLQQLKDTIASILAENEQQMMLFQSKPTWLLSYFGFCEKQITEADENQAIGKAKP